MKIKIDFVTNSSSTGYVFYGFVLDKTDKIFQGISNNAFYDENLFVKEMNLPKCVNVYISINDAVIIGKNIMYAHDDSGIEERDVDLDRLIQEAKYIAKVVKDSLKLDQEPKLIGGVDGQG